MVKTRISSYQLFYAILLVPYSTAALFFLTPDAKNDSWIAMLIYILPAVILQIVYTSLWRKYPEDTIFTYMPKIFGKFIGCILSIIYIIYFSYIAARVLRDITEIIAIAVMPVMPSALIALILILVIGYSTYVNVENICRLAQVLAFVFIVYFIMEWIFLLTTPDALKFYNLKPVLQDGIILVIKKTWKIVTFPFGESIFLTILYPSVVEVSKVRKASIFAVISLGILLSINSIKLISVLGPDFAANSTFPLMETMRVMKIGESFDRVDIFVILILLLGGFIKTSFIMYGAMLGTAQLTKIKNTKYLAVPFSILIFIASQLIAQNYPQHVYRGLVWTVFYVHLPLMIFIPITALMVYYSKRFFKKLMSND